MDRKKTRSVRLKKYESVYKEYLKNKSRSPEPESKTHTRKKLEKIKEPDKKVADSEKGRKKLTDYQKFVKDENKKEKYKDIKPGERMIKIAKAWKKRNLQRDTQSKMTRI